MSTNPDLAPVLFFELGEVVPGSGDIRTHGDYAVRALVSYSTLSSSFSLVSACEDPSSLHPLLRYLPYRWRLHTPREADRPQSLRDVTRT